MNKRTRARELAMQALYQLDAQGTEFTEQLNEFFSENCSDEYICKLASEWCKGTWDNLTFCDELICNSAAKWKLPKLLSVDRSILRLSVYQLYFCRDIPPRVVINEAIELAKKFSTEKSPSFVNGVLDAVLKNSVKIP